MAATIEQIQDDLSDYADYEELASVSRARTFITACIRFLQHATQQADQGTSLVYDAQSIRELLKHARAFVQANDTGTDGRGVGVRTIGPSSGFRGH